LGPCGILIDDNGRNIGQWLRRGGIGILHKNTESTIEVLEALEKNPYKTRG
jgi:hypothetical protein